MLRKKKQN